MYLKPILVPFFMRSILNQKQLMALLPVLKFLIVLLSLSHFLLTQANFHAATEAPMSWTNNYPFSDNIILLSEDVDSNNWPIDESRPAYACGFYSLNGETEFFDSLNGEDQSFYFGVGAALKVDDYAFFSNIIWTANRNNPVRENASLHLFPDGNLVLREADGTLVWTTNTSNMSVAGMKMKKTGNLVLHDSNNRAIWQSFDHPTDTLVPGQKLLPGQKLVASFSETNLSEGSFYISVTPEAVLGFYQSNVPQMYFRFSIPGTVGGMEIINNTYNTSNLALNIFAASPSEPDVVFTTTTVDYPLMAYLRLDPDGHLRIYSDFANQFYHNNSVDLFADILSECDQPLSCGRYGIHQNGECLCPGGFAEEHVSNAHDSYGCFENNPVSCDFHQSQYLMPLSNVYYFNHIDPDAAALLGAGTESCKAACLRNYSSQASFFRYFYHFSQGKCSAPLPVLSLIYGGRERKRCVLYAFNEISNDTVSSGGERGRGSSTSASRVAIITGLTLGTFSLGLIVSFWIVLLRRKRHNKVEGTEGFPEELASMPMRFTYEELKVATQDFQKKLGGGGFGSVFEGNLETGETIAVKRLDSIGQGKKEFLAEVNTIGYIHHVNLVRIAGFCAEKHHRLLVYEFMCSGSLDRWIFYKEPLQPPLDWQTRNRIIQDIARGLAYLHEDCCKRMLHLDIKPQNILLDADLNAKISDFGLSKWIERDQNQVATTMRGTPGYLAPEWSSSVITEKVDVYSFGIVVMEVVCGRKNVDRSQPEDFMHLLAVVMNKAKEDQLADMVDNRCEDMQFHSSEAVQMVRLAIWCVQRDFTRRPSMSIVVKVLEGSMDVEADLDYSIQKPETTPGIRREVELGTMTTLLPSLLSGPR